MARWKKISFWQHSTNPKYDECAEVLHEVADEYLKKALDELDEYLADGYTHVKRATLAKIPGCYCARLFNQYKDEMECEMIDYGRGFNSDRPTRVYEINSVKEWLKEKYREAKEDRGYRSYFPGSIYVIARNRCKKMGLI